MKNSYFNNCLFNRANACRFLALVLMLGVLIGNTNAQSSYKEKARQSDKTKSSRQISWRCESSRDGHFSTTTEKALKTAELLELTELHLEESSQPLSLCKADMRLNSGDRLSLIVFDSGLTCNAKGDCSIDGVLFNDSSASPLHENQLLPFSDNPSFHHVAAGKRFDYGTLNDLGFGQEIVLGKSKIAVRKNRTSSSIN